MASQRGKDHHAIAKVQRGQAGEIGVRKKNSAEDLVIAIQKDGVSQTVTLRQMPLTSMPRRRIEMAADGPTHEVQTLVEKTSKGLNLTLYRNTLLLPSQFERITIEPVTKDSLIVDLADERIAYHIPGGWSAQPSTRPVLERQ
jgi:hypothetical protein